jgi:hypothetical protein
MRRPKARLIIKGAGFLRSHRGSTIAALSVLLVAGVSKIWLSADGWGAAGQWAGAFGTVLAVTVALRISQREADAAEARRRADKVEAERLRRADKSEAEERQRAEKAERELSQARLVVAVIDYLSPEQEQASHPDEKDVIFVRITNYSEAHIFNPRVEGFVHQNGGTVTWDIVEWDVSGYEGPPDVLPTGGTDRIPVYPKFAPPVTSDMYPMRTKVIFGYTDVAGRRWRRIDQATPERVYSDDTFQISGPDWYRADT